LIADHFKFDPVGQTDLASQTRRADGLVGVVAARGVRQQEIFLGVDVVEQRFLAATMSRERNWRPAMINGSVMLSIVSKWSELVSGLALR
jgi:hypothetical protein